MYSRETHIHIARPEFSFGELFRHAVKWFWNRFPNNDRSCSLSKAGKGADYWGRGPVGDQLRPFDPEVITGFVPTASLLHLTEPLQELGIQRKEHLRALAKIHEETRYREVREEALKKGVAAAEWELFLDKLEALYPYDDIYVN